MGDWHHWIADLEAAPEEAPILATRVLDWLIGAGIVRAERTDCVLGEADGGYAAGPAYSTVVTEIRAGFPDDWANGLEIDIGRSVFYDEVREDDRVTCPLCATWLPLDVVLPAVEEWTEGGPDSLVCLGCGRMVALNDWQWPTPWACAQLGFRFWNWPPLTGDFRAAVAHRLGHRTIAGRTAT